MSEAIAERLNLTAPRLNEAPYVVVEGPVGVGKTTFAGRLAKSLGCRTLFEQVDQNPFLERFYQDPRGSALPTQLHFLFQRLRQIDALRQGDLFESGVIADFMPAKERLFAGVTLDDDEYRLYEEVASRVGFEAPSPDLVVYLQAPVQVLLERIARRGRDIERQLDSAYLQRLVDAYNRLFYHYDESPLLIVNAADIDLTGEGGDYDLLLEQICSIGPGRHYFNPAPIALG